MSDLAAEGDRLHAAALPATWAATTVNDCLGQGPFDENDDEWCVYDPEEDDPPLLGLGSMPREYAQWIAWSYTNWPAIAAALRERDEREHYAASRDERITELLRERDESLRRVESVYIQIERVERENDVLRAQLATAEAERTEALMLLRETVSDLYTVPTIWRRHRDIFLDRIDAAHAAAVEGRHAD